MENARRVQSRNRTSRQQTTTRVLSVRLIAQLAVTHGRSLVRATFLAVFASRKIISLDGLQVDLNSRYAIKNHPDTDTL